jgi:hypothetical protein
MHRNRFRFIACVFLSFVISPSLLAAHDMPANTIMNAFVKIEPKQAHLVVRIPLDLLRGLSLPLEGDHYDLAMSGPATQQALPILSEGFMLLENGVRLTPSESSGRLSLPSNRSFQDYDAAVAFIAQPADLSTTISYSLGFFDVHFVYPIASPKSVFKIQSLIGVDLGNRTKLTVRYMPLGESSRAMMIPGDSGPVALDPAWYHAAGGFVVLGIEHILSGIDHLLFLFCLVIPYRRLRGLISVITAFTVAHSVTLFASAFHLAPKGAWFPPFVEMAIACSIVYMALENIVGANLRRRWLITGMFGLVHGFRFFQRPGRVPAVRRLTPADVAILLQRRHRDRPTLCAGGDASRARLVPPHCPGADGRNHSVRPRRPHRLALDDGALASAVAGRMATPGRRRAR